MNTASRMESTSHPGLIQVSEATWNLLKDTESFRPTGGIEIKGKGLMPTFIWAGERAGSRRGTRTNHAAPAKNAAAPQDQSREIISKAMAAAVAAGDDDLVVSKRLKLRRKRSTTCANLKICVKSQRRKSFAEHSSEYL